jgi:hypothetical protein
LVLALTALVGLAAAENAYPDTVPDAPDAQVCQLAGGHSNCDFKAQMSGTPTSVVGNRVIVVRKTKMGAMA